MEIANALWVEKYRPKKLDDLILSERYKKDFSKIIARKQLSNLLFSGPPGGGKSTLARILCSKEGVLFNQKDNALVVNGSAKKSRGINYVDAVIEPFLKIPPTKGDLYRIVFIDEADKLTTDGYDSLRAIIEKYQVTYGRFIFTCNYISKIPGPLQSRFTPYVFQQIPKEFVISYSKSILESENIEYDEKDIKFVIENLYPDVRRIIDTLQQNSLHDNKLEVDEKSVTSNEKIILSQIVEIVGCVERNENTKVSRCINLIIEVLEKHDIEYRGLYTQLFFMKKFPSNAKIIVNKYSNSHQACLVPHQHFIAMVFEIIKSLQEYKIAMVKR
jgi:DNA polymerase III delta prime subunit